MNKPQINTDELFLFDEHRVHQHYPIYLRSHLHLTQVQVSVVNQGKRC